jgi:hypothetical protein
LITPLAIVNIGERFLVGTDVGLRAALAWSSVYRLPDGRDPKDVIRILDNLATFSGINIYVLSREYAVFRDAYDRRPTMLHLEDPTANDIREYVRKALEENSRFREILQAKLLSTIPGI